LALDGGEWSASCPICTIPGGKAPACYWIKVKVLPLHEKQAHGGGRCIAVPLFDSCARKWWEAGGQCHTLAALLLGKDHPLGRMHMKELPSSEF